MHCAKITINFIGIIHEKIYIVNPQDKSQNGFRVFQVLGHFEGPIRAQYI